MFCFITSPLNKWKVIVLEANLMLHFVFRHKQVKLSITAGIRFQVAKLGLGSEGLRKSARGSKQKLNLAVLSPSRPECRALSKPQGV